MGMSAPKGGGDDAAPVAEINVTPLVDVMLVLLIIFMVSMPLMMSQLSITIPQSSVTPPAGKPPDKVVFTLDQTGAYAVSINDTATPLTYEALGPKLIELVNQYKTEHLITVKASEKIDYARVVALVELIGKTGFSKVTLDVIPYGPAGADGVVPAPAG
jgi:biopolymer transport protein ExbD